MVEMYKSFSFFFSAFPIFFSLAWKKESEITICQHLLQWYRDPKIAKYWYDQETWSIETMYNKSVVWRSSLAYKRYITFI